MPAFSPLALFPPPLSLSLARAPLSSLAHLRRFSFFLPKI